MKKLLQPLRILKQPILPPPPPPTTSYQPPRRSIPSLDPSHLLPLRSKTVPAARRRPQAQSVKMQEEAHDRPSPTAPPPIDYSQWSQVQLVERVTELEKLLKEQQQQQLTIHKKSSILPPPSSLSPEAPSSSHSKRAQRIDREFDPSKYSTRFIALKVAYLGRDYNGFEHHANNIKPLPTIEEVLWRALRKARLIFPKNVGERQDTKVDWDGCEYSKCGRTDRGVSAFGQVIGLRVRSSRLLDERVSARESDGSSSDQEWLAGKDSIVEVAGDSLSEELPSEIAHDDEVLQEDIKIDHRDDATSSFDPIRDELPYPLLLNRLLPEDIRVLAWCPFPPPDFSARFSCKERQYRYFFTQPAFAALSHGPGRSSISGASADADATDKPAHSNGAHSNNSKAKNQSEQQLQGWLDLEAMREAARSFIGVHDFRNFCKVDPSKQITNFERRIYHANIIEVGCKASPPGHSPQHGSSSVGSTSTSSSYSDRHEGSIRWSSDHPRVYAFVVHGSAFLWHQVRQMAAILFLIGQGLESPSLVSRLLDIKTQPCKPIYDMAADAPLVLWDCIFPQADDPQRKDALDWVYVGEKWGRERDYQSGYERYGSRSVLEGLWSVWRRRKIDEVLIGSLLDVAASHVLQSCDSQKILSEGVQSKVKMSQRVFDGGDTPKLRGTYVPVLERRKLETVEQINRRYVRARPQGSEIDQA